MYKRILEEFNNFGSTVISFSEQGEKINIGLCQGTVRLVGLKVMTNSKLEPNKH